MEIKRDIICQVFAGKKSKSTIYQVLNAFIPEYEKLDTDYASKPDDKEYVFKTEDEMINYFIENPRLSQTFYWNKYHNNADKIMVGARITKDDELIVSLTIDGNEVTEKLYFEKLKEILQSKIGVITYFNPAEYENGQDFISKYGNISI